MATVVQDMRGGNEVIRKKILHLPWPPSVNHYWQAKGSKRFISKRGYQYRLEVLAVVWQAYAGKPMCLREGVRVTIEAHPPDNRARDLDNVLKAPLDAITKAGVIIDDKQINDLRIVRRPITRGGLLILTIEAE